MQLNFIQFNSSSLKNYDVYRLTKYLAIFSLIALPLSYLTQNYLHEDFYPFFYWQLYTSPSGHQASFTDYRLYIVTEKDDTIRLPNDGYQYWSQDDYYYFLSREIHSQAPVSEQKKRLSAFGKMICPDSINAKEFLFVSEKFHPNKIIEEESNFQPKVLLSTLNDLE